MILTRVKEIKYKEKYAREKENKNGKNSPINLKFTSKKDIF
jgi:hypothetical protein